MQPQKETMKMIEYTYKIADHWLSPIINGDYSGLEDQEEAQLNDFLASIPKHFHHKSKMHACFDVVDEEGSFDVDEVSGLHANCYAVTVTYI